MKQSSGIKALVVSMLGAFVLAACSGSSEDPRISFCRGVAADLTGTGPEVAWSSAGNEFKEPEYAMVKVATDAGQSVTCYYEYDVVENTALDLADPLSSYATLPYKVALDGVALNEQQVAEAVKAEQVRLGQKVVEVTQKTVDNAVERVKQAVEGVDLQKTVDDVKAAVQNVDLNETAEQVKTKLDEAVSE